MKGAHEGNVLWSVLTGCSTESMDLDSVHTCDWSKIFVGSIPGPMLEDSLSII